MADFVVNFSQLNIGVKTIYDFSSDLCKDYITTSNPDFCVETNQNQIEEELKNSPYNPPKDYAESICLYREIAEKLPIYNRFVFHGAVIEYENMGFVFTAKSGTGKTTHIRLWQKYLGEDKVQIVNGDKPIMQITDDGIIAYSTPYAGKEGYENHSQVKLNAICIIRRGLKNKITKVNSSSILVEMFNQIYRPSNQESAVKMLDLLDKFLKLPIFVLECDMSEDAVKTSFNALTNQNFDDKKFN